MAVPGRRNGLREEGDDGDRLVRDMEWVDEEIEDDDDDDTPPHLQAVADASEKGDRAALLYALDNRTFSIDEPLEDGDTALHLCCLYGHLPCVQLLVERGANIEVKDEDEAIPLHDACAVGFTAIAQYLINVADAQCVQRMLNTVDLEGDTPLHHAARGEHLGAIQVLLAAGASRTKANIYGMTPAELADPETDARLILEGRMCQ